MEQKEETKVEEIEEDISDEDTVIDGKTIKPEDEGVDKVEEIEEDISDEDTVIDGKTIKPEDEGVDKVEEIEEDIEKASSNGIDTAIKVATAGIAGATVFEVAEDVVGPAVLNEVHDMIGNHEGNGDNAVSEESPDYDISGGNEDNADKDENEDEDGVKADLSSDNEILVNKNTKGDNWFVKTLKLPVSIPMYVGGKIEKVIKNKKIQKAAVVGGILLATPFYIGWKVARGVWGLGKQLLGFEDVNILDDSRSSKKKKAA